MKEEAVKKPVKMKERIRKTHSKAEFVGILYLIGTIVLAAMAFLPLMYGAAGKIWVANFWKSYKSLKAIKTSAPSVVVDLFGAVVYTLLLLTAVINVLRSLSRMNRLFKKKASRFNGFNRNAIAMEEMGKIYSGTYCVTIAFPFMIHLVTGASFTNLFYIAVVAGLIFHFWGGLVGGNVSLFTVGENVEEEKRTLGRWAPFFRNLMQLAFVGLIMYYISRTNLMTNALKWLEKDAFKTLFKAKADAFVYGLVPLLQLLVCLWTLVLLKHATASTEYDRDGKDASGMKNFRVFSILVLITSGALFGLMYWANTKRDYIVPMMGTLYIAIIALAALIEEFCMCRLPNVKGKVVEEDETGEDVDIDPDAPRTEEKAAPEEVPAVYHIPLQCVTQPGVFMQPNGQPVMVMPMIAGLQTPPAAPDGADNGYGAYYNPYASYWTNGRPYRPFNSYQYVQEPETPTEVTEEAEPVKANFMSGDKKARRAQKNVEKKENRTAAEKEAVEKALADKWIRKGRQPVTETSGIAAAETVSETTAEEQKNLPALLPAPAYAPVAEEVPRQAVMESYAYQLPRKSASRIYPEATDLTEDDLLKPLPPKRWTVTCPDCATKLSAYDGAFAYRCPECGGVFQLRKVYRAKRKAEAVKSESTSEAE